MAATTVSLPGPEDLAGWTELIDRLEPPIEVSRDEQKLVKLRQRMLGAIANMTNLSGRRVRGPHPARYEGPYPNRPE